jgi:hypothetical protein
MLLWINGPFGGGKTHVAAEIQHRHPHVWIADPELVGFGLHRMMPQSARQDFQDLASWRAGVVEALHTALTQHDGLVIAPQTLVNADYFDEILGSLRERGHDVRHVALMARPETVLQRLRDRGFGRAAAALGRDTLARESFAVERITPYLARLAEPRFAEHIWTDDLAIGQVAEAVAEIGGFRLTPAEGGPLRTALRRARTTIRHIRGW